MNEMMRWARMMCANGNDVDSSGVVNNINNNVVTCSWPTFLCLVNNSNCSPAKGKSKSSCTLLCLCITALCLSAPLNGLSPSMRLPYQSHCQLLHLLETKLAFH